MKLPANYNQIIVSLKEKIRVARQTAILTVNAQLLDVYREIGKVIAEQEKAEGWGAKTVERLSADLKAEFEDMKGLSPRNLRYMRDFYLAYYRPDILQQVAAKLKGTEIQPPPILQQAVAKLPWGHHMLILTKVKTLEERTFYIQKCIENNWSRNILSLQIENELYERQGRAITNFSRTLPAPQSDLARETLKNPYLLEFLDLDEDVQERELEKALIQHLKQFLHELGRGFAYVGNQKNLVVEEDDFFLDLLFYNYHLHCFVIFELKVGDFKPEFAGKLNFYVNTVNEQLKGKQDNPTIGVLLCKTPNKTVVKYSLTGIDSPIGVADYELAKALPKKLKGEIPSVEELEAEVDKGYEELKTPAEKRLDRLKEKLAGLKVEEIKTPATYPILCSLFDKSIVPLFQRLIDKLEDFNNLFIFHNYFWIGDSSITDLDQLSKFWKDENYLKANHKLQFYYRLNGFKKGGPDSFDMVINFTYQLDVYSYGFVLTNYNNNQPFYKKYYHQQLTKEDIEAICNTVYDVVVGEIETKVEYITK